MTPFVFKPFQPLLVQSRGQETSASGCSGFDLGSEGREPLEVGVGTEVRVVGVLGVPETDSPLLNVSIVESAAASCF